MEINDVKLIHHPEIKPGTLEDGLPVPERAELFVFDVDVVGEEANVYVPNEPNNSQYWLVKEWYDAQEVKPFEFTFEELSEPEFEETIYPPEPEENSDTEEVEA